MVPGMLFYRWCKYILIVEAAAVIDEVLHECLFSITEWAQVLSELGFCLHELE
jgi:hypothetical protein